MKNRKSCSIINNLLNNKIETRFPSVSHFTEAGRTLFSEEPLDNARPMCYSSSTLEKILSRSGAAW